MTDKRAMPGRWWLVAALVAWSCKGGGNAAANSDSVAAAADTASSPTAASSDSGRDAAGEPPPNKETTYKRGRVTFEYKGKQESWTLQSGKLIQSPAAEGMKASTTVGLFYTRDGSERSIGDGMLSMSISDLNLMGPGGFHVMELGLSSTAGGPRYRPKMGDRPCAVAIRRVDAGGAEGTFTCAGTFIEGSPIGKVTFSASP